MDAKQVNDQKATASTVVKTNLTAREKKLEEVDRLLKSREMQKFLKKSFLPAMKRLANE